jgi:hypothetical protein
MIFDQFNHKIHRFTTSTGNSPQPERILHIFIPLNPEIKKLSSNFSNFSQQCPLSKICVDGNNENKGLKNNILKLDKL